MGRIRLQVQVLSCGQSATTSLNGEASEEKPIIWCQPCSEEDSIQDLYDKILAKWSQMYVGYGSLNVRYLTTFWDEKLSTDEKVGALFDDRKDAREIPPTSIIKVVREPPLPSELMRMPQRFGSLIPESAARPRKRMLPTHEQWVTKEEHREGFHSSRTTSVAFKRPRLNDGTFNPNLPLPSSEDHSTGLFQVSEHSGQDIAGDHTKGHQSLRPQKETTPYGTPISLSLVSPQELVDTNPVDYQAIPDSPSGRIIPHPFAQPVDLERESTKSESPEILVTMDKVPINEAADELADPVLIEVPATNPSNNLCAPRPSLPQMPQQLVTGSMALNDVQSEDENDGSAVQSVAKSRPAFMHMSLNRNHRRSDGLLHETDTILDPIESNSYSFSEEQKLHRSKRQKLDHTTPRQRMVPFRRSSSNPNENESHEVQNKTWTDRRPTELKAHVTSVGPMEIGDHILANVPNEDVGGPEPGSTKGVRDQDLQAHHTNNFETQAPDATSTQGPEKYGQEMLRRDVEAEVLPLQATGISDMAASRLARHESEAIVEQAESTEAPSHVVIPADEAAASENDNIGNLAGDVRRNHSESSAEISRTMVAVEVRVRVPNGQDVSSGCEAANRQLKEAALKEQAEKIMITADGVKQLDVERSRNESTTSTTGATPAIKKLITYSRTPQQKAKRAEREKAKRAEFFARTIAEDAKLPESKKTRTDGTPNSAEQATMPKETYSERVGKHRDAHRVKFPGSKEAGQTEQILQKLSELSDKQDRRSNTPSDAGWSISQVRKSMTPMFPRSSATKSSSSIAGNPASSSPLAQRSTINANTPLRSALKWNSSTLRRSVSFADEATRALPINLPAARLKDEGAHHQKSLVDLNRELLATSKRGTSLPIAVASSKKTSSRGSGKKSTARLKVQTKLNVTRDKKLKGRLIEPLSPTQPGPEEEAVPLSSDDESFSYLDDFDENEEPTPGSSSRKSSSSRSTGPPDPSSTNQKAVNALDIGPAILEESVDGKNPRLSTTDSAETSREASASRSPAQPATDSNSASSESDTGPTSRFGSGSSNSDRSVSESELDSVGTSTEKLIHDRTVNGLGSPVSNESITIRGSGSARTATQPSNQSPQKRETSVYHNNAMNVVNPSERASQAAGKGSLVNGNKAAQSADKQELSSKRTPSQSRAPIKSTRPKHPWRYPSLSQMKKQALSDKPYELPPVQEKSSATAQVDLDSSSEDESSSDLDEDEVPNANGSLNRGRTLKDYPGMSSILKLARKVRSAEQK